MFIYQIKLNSIAYSDTIQSSNKQWDLQMSIPITVNQECGSVTMIEVASRGDLQIISKRLDCFENPSVNNELFVDFLTIDSNEDLLEATCELFGSVEDIPAGIVLFYCD